MTIERSAVGGIGSGEGRHLNRIWITFPVEELIKIGIFYEPQQDTHATRY